MLCTRGCKALGVPEAVWAGSRRQGCLLSVAAAVQGRGALVEGKGTALTLGSNAVEALLGAASCVWLSATFLTELSSAALLDTASLACSQSMAVCH